MRRITARLLALAAIAWAQAVNSDALDHKNLDAGRPLKLEDPYALAAGEFAVEAGAGFSRNRGDSEQGIFPLQVLYGASPNFQVSLGSAYLDPRRPDDAPKSGDLGLGALYNLNQETLSTPALGLKAEGRFPTGEDSSGTDARIGLLITKSVDRLSLHLNGSHEFLGGAPAGARDGRNRLVFGASHPWGAPRRTLLTLVADAFVEQSVMSGTKETVGAEIGFRRMLSPRVVWDAGLGREFSGPPERLALTFTTGLSVGF
ncbi:MAG: hypothetical protein HYZ75_12290 [Elusimicrobia bacterium]|nr:hypothetical protein [Elusimicrobiota bacterium]